MASSGVAVFEYHVACYRRTWRGTVLSSFVTPVLLFLGIGVAVGSYVDQGGVLDLPYVKLYGPGLLALTGVQIAVLESSAPVMSRLADRIYHSMSATPVHVGGIIGGHLGYVAARIAIGAVAVLLVMVPYGAVRSGWALTTPLIAILVGLATAAPVLAYAATIYNVSRLVVTLRLVTLPMTFFSGVFFPVEQLPTAVGWVARIVPLWHGVELVRAAAAGIDAAWPMHVHLGYLTLWAAGGSAAAVRFFDRRLKV